MTCLVFKRKKLKAKGLTIYGILIYFRNVYIFKNLDGSYFKVDLLGSTT